jgi:hypothetical protein
MSYPLYNLIKSLSKAEKRFFKLEVSHYTLKANKVYIELYEILAQQAQYKESLLKKKFADTPSAKRLPQLKNYLYNLILKILIKYNTQKNIDFKITELLQSVDILFTKGLYKQSQKLLKKAKKIALHYNKTHHLIRIYEWEHNFALMEYPLKKIIKTGKKFLKEKSVLIEDINNIFEYEKTYYNIMPYLFSDGKKSPENAVFAARLYEQPILQTEHYLTSWQTKNIYYFVHSAYAYFGNDADKTHFYTQLRVATFSTIKGLQEEEINKYLNAAYNYIQILIENSDFDTARKQIDEVEFITDKLKTKIEERNRHLAFTIIYTHKIQLLEKENDYESVVSLGQKLKQNDQYLIPRKDQEKNYFIVLRQIASAHFILEEPKEAIYWLDLILDNQLWSIRMDLLGFIQIFYIILQYEVDNYGILEFYINKTERFLNKHKIFSKYEKVLIRFLRKYTQSILLADKQKEALLWAKEQLDIIKQKKEYPENKIKRMQLDAWIESKLTGDSIYEILIKQVQSAK